MRRILNILLIIGIIVVLGLIARSLCLTDVDGENVYYALTLKEAYLLARRDIEDDGFQLHSLRSVDRDSVLNDLGLDGRRYFWGLWFNLSGTDEFLSVDIRNGNVIEIFEFNGYYGASDLIRKELIKLDSPEALKRAVDVAQLIPGEVWAIGYHFTLRHYPEGIIMSVIGLSPDRMFRRVNINLTTDEIEIIDKEHLFLTD